VALVAQGKSNKEIAAVLGLSVKTVASHLSRLFARLGVTNRTQAAMAWLAVDRIDRPTRIPAPDIARVEARTEAYFDETRTRRYTRAKIRQARASKTKTAASIP
jgi:hypothetical protein